MKKAGVAVAIFGVLVLVVVMYLKSKPSNTAPITDTKVATANIDTDGDGLPDWEEVLWGSDPNKTDTDGDGTNDNQEVQQNRNPVIPGPGDEIKVKEADANVPTTTPYKYEYDNSLGSTLTEKLALNLSANYLSAKSKGGLTAATKDELVNNLLSQIGDVELYHNYTRTSIAIGPMGTTFDIEMYGGRINAGLDKFGQLGLGESKIIADAVTADNLDGLDGLNAYASKYRTFRTTLLNMQVPLQFADLHVSFTNAVDTVAKSLAEMPKLKEDPVSLMREISRYKLAMETISSVYKEGVDLANKLTNT